MRNRNSIDIFAGLAAVAALMVIFLSFYEFAPGTNRVLHEAIGKALAKETVSLLGVGGQITIISRDTEAFHQPAMDILLDTFQRESHRAGATIASVKLIQNDPLRPVDVPSGDFFEIIRRAKPGEVVVSFFGPPLLSEEQRSKLGRIQPKIVAFCSGGMAEQIDLPQLMRAGLLHAAVASRPLTSSKPASPTTFDQLYRIIKAATPAAGQ